MVRVEVKGLHICEKCGNVMVTRVLKRDGNPDSTHFDRILQCIVCKHWVSSD